MRVLQKLAEDPKRPYPRRCPCCRFAISPGQTVIYVNRSMQFHRRCLTLFVDSSYDTLPIQPDEIVGHCLFPETKEEREAKKRVRDMERAAEAEAKFEEQRRRVAAKLGVEIR